MNIDVDEPLKPVLAALNVRQKLRVWSVIITFFGDTIVPRGGIVAAKTVQDVLGRLGIEPGAVRTAFSRLARDGWVTREKIGRTSFYRLSADGLEPFLEAESIIYRSASEANSKVESWLFAIHNDRAYSNVLLGQPDDETRNRLTKEDYFIIEGDLKNVPNWMMELYAPQSIADAMKRLMTDFAILDVDKLEGLDAVAARCLLIHEWRRLRLRIGDLPPELWPNDWPQEACCAFVSQRYERLLSASELWLDKNAVGPSGLLPSPDPKVGIRFR